MRNFLLSVAVFAAFLWAGLRWIERRLTYFPNANIAANPAQVGLPFEEVWLKTEDHRKIHAWWIPAAQDGAPTVLLSHGNAGNISHRLDKATRLRSLGLNVLLYDYQGFGKSEGWPSEGGTYADAEAAYRYLIQEKRVGPDRLLFYGESLGCAVAVDLAKRHAPAALILEAPFSSALDMADRLLPKLRARWWSRMRYDNVAKIPQVHCPLLILHSKTDDVIPYDLARKLFDAANSPKDFVILIGDHNQGYADSGEIYLKGIASFLKRSKIHPGRPLQAHAGEQA